MKEFLDMVLEETTALSRSNEEKRLGRKLTPDEDEKAVENAKAAVSVHKFGWQERYKALRAEILNGVKNDLGVNNLARAKRSDVNGYTVRLVLFGYSYGAATAVNWANVVKADLERLGLIVKIEYFGTVDGVENTGANDGLPLARRPADPNAPVHNSYTLTGPFLPATGQMLHGGRIPNAVSEDQLLTETHESIDEAVLTGDQGRKLAALMAKFALESFPGGAAADDEEE